MSEIYHHEPQIVIAVAALVVTFVAMKLIQDLLNHLVDKLSKDEALSPAHKGQMVALNHIPVSPKN